MVNITIVGNNHNVSALLDNNKYNIIKHSGANALLYNKYKFGSEIIIWDCDQTLLERFHHKIPDWVAIICIVSPDCDTSHCCHYIITEDRLTKETMEDTIQKAKLHYAVYRVLYSDVFLSYNKIIEITNAQLDLAMRDCEK